MGINGNRLFLGESGFVGIGTTSPGSLLSIQSGNLQVTGTSTTNALVATSTLFVGSTGQFFNVMQNGFVGIGTTSPGSLLSVHGGNAQITGTTTSNSLIATSTLFVGSIGQLFNVLQNGFVGIGTTSPSSLLSVHGNTLISGTSTVNSLIATSTLFVGSTGNLFNVLQSGLVGIGTTSPSSLLSIHGNALISGTSTAGSLIATSTLFVGSSGNLLSVLQNGFIGIGTTSPSSLLSVQGIANFVPNATSTLYTALSLPSIYSTSTIATSTFAGSLYVASSTPTQNALFAVGTSSPLLFIDKNTGSVGIATTSTAQNFLFAVYGTSSPSIFVDRNSGKIGIGSSSPSARLAINGFGTGSDRGLVFADSSNTERLTVLDNGNVGIGTTATEGALHVQAADSTTAPQIVFGNDGGKARGGIGWDGTDGNFGGKVHIYARAQGAAYSGGFNRGITVNTIGNVGIGTTDPSAQKLVVAGNVRVGTGTTGCVEDADGTLLTGTCSSDIRLKQNITPLPSVLDRLVNLTPVTYNWRSAEFPERQLGASTQTGLIAQDVEAQFPELVVEDDKGFKQIAFQYLPFYMLQGMKELNIKIEDLQRNSAQTSDSSGFSLSSLVDMLKQFGIYLEQGIVRATEFIAERIRTKELCVGETCVNEQQLKELLEKNQISAFSTPTPPPISPPPSPEPEPQPSTEIATSSAVIFSAATSIPEVIP